MPEPALIAVPLELLERNTRAMEDAVVEMRLARQAAEATRDEAREHHKREEPALKLVESYVQSLTDADVRAATEAKARAEQAASEREAALVKEQAAAAEARAATIRLVLQIVVPLVAALAGAGGTVAYFGGAGATP